MNFKKLNAISFHRHHKEFADCIRPERDWKIFLIAFSIVGVLTLGGSAYLFYKIGKGEIFTANTESPAGIDSIDRTKLNELVSYYNEKEKVFNERAESPSAVLDPSR